MNLKEIYFEKAENKYYDIGSMCVNLILASMGMNYSQLISHLFRNNIIQNSLCICGIEETVFIIFLNVVTFWTREIVSWWKHHNIDSWGGA